ncbi:MAG: FAD-dependent oxidoreductase, partial [Candidatus Aenigmarchaeota archaeon]|nr:FAD-dependent oxidoreductase [Candidatus Aenigmarchaeota archaeon]
DKTTVSFIEKLGLKNKLKRKRVSTGFIYQNKVFGFSSPFEILNFPLSLRDKMKLAFFVLKASRKKDWKDVEKLSAKEWIVKEAGEKNYDIIFEQLIKNKFNDSPEKISAAWFGSRFAAEPSSFLKKFGWLEGGLQQFIDAFEKEITKNGEIEKNVKVEKIDLKNNKLTYVKAKKKIEERYDVLISTIPPEVFLRVVSNASQKIKEELKKIEYLSCICLCLGLKSSPTKYYWLNILDKDKPFVAFFNYTQLFEDLAPEGKSVIFLVTYLRKKDKLWEMSEKEIFSLYLKHLKKIFPGIEKEVEWWKVNKFEHAEAIFSLGFKNPPISKGNVYFAGIYRIFPKIRNMASALESGIEVVEALIGEKVEI